MSSFTEKLIRPSSKRIEHVAHVATTNVWDLLDCFVRDLDGAESISAQICCVLDAVRACIQADTVFAHSSQAGVPLKYVSGKPIPASWRRQFVARDLETLSSTRKSYGRFSGTPANADAGGISHRTLMVNFKKSKPLWIVAVNFDSQHQFRREDLKIVLLIRRLFRDHGSHAQTQAKLTDAILGVVGGLNEAINAKSPFTSGHSERVARMAVRLGRQMKLPSAVLSDLYLAGLLHDVGKIGIRDDVLQKQGPLTDEETAHIREHPLIGDSIVAKIKNLTHLRPGVRNHHERFDGFGYPDGLAGDAIPLLARILSVADACDAMMSPRPYRRGLSTEQVNIRMSDGAGSQWDPALIVYFMACRHELYNIYEKGIGDSMVHAVTETVRERLDD
jgi:HD-GYP domain-containing protein (c-di-GMP phosphodiesterase class II)